MKPQKIDRLTQAFPASVMHLMPDRNDPDYRKYLDENRDSWGFKLFSDWFYAGLESPTLVPKDGINTAEAVTHIRTIMGSFEPKHEHKTAAVAYLLEHWFESATWERKKLKQLEAK